MFALTRQRQGKLSQGSQGEGMAKLEDEQGHTRGKTRLEDEQGETKGKARLEDRSTGRYQRNRRYPFLKVFEILQKLKKLPSCR